MGMLAFICFDNIGTAAQAAIEDDRTSIGGERQLVVPPVWVMADDGHSILSAVSASGTHNNNYHMHIRQQHLGLIQPAQYYADYIYVRTLTHFPNKSANTLYCSLICHANKRVWATTSTSLHSPYLSPLHAPYLSLLCNI